MICWTRRPSRPPSIFIRLAKCCTASGSSAASWTASASRVSAPIGVLSSWETLATKSRRIASTCFSRVRSSASTRTSRLLSAATRACTCRGGARALDVEVDHPGLAVAAYLPDQVAQLRHGSSEPWTSPIAYAGAEAWSTWSSSSTTSALERARSARSRRRVGRPRPRRTTASRRGAELAVADPPGQDGHRADEHAEEGEDQVERGRVHVLDGRRPRESDRPSGV